MRVCACACVHYHRAVVHARHCTGGALRLGEVLVDLPLAALRRVRGQMAVRVAGPVANVPHRLLRRLRND